MEICSYLIHYTKLTERLANSLQVLLEVGLRPEIVRCWDGDSLFYLEKGYQPSDETWLNHIITVAPILLSNAGYSVDLSVRTELKRLANFPKQAIEFLPSWMKPRTLSRGELSVLLKHYYAISRIAQGEASYGLIAEDDLVLRPSSKELFEKSVNEFIKRDGDYLDLAGGCGLTQVDPGLEAISRIYPPSTRTNACYIVSKQLAKLIAERFFPVASPIDWHLLYLLNSIDSQRCYWSKEECFIHGSENGVYTSWRSV